MDIPLFLREAPAAAVDEDLLLGRTIPYLQALVGGVWPNVGLLSAALAPRAEPGVNRADALATGVALRSGLVSR